MAYNFPDNPTEGQVFEAWTWNGVAWVLTLPLNVEYVLKSGDVMAGHLGLPAGPAATQAVRKDYVDASIAAIPAPDLSSKVSKSGDTMSGALTVQSDISAYRGWDPTTGYVFLGNSGARYVGWDSANYQMPGGSLYTANGRLWGTNDGTPLFLHGGTMTGQITTAASQNIAYGGNAGSLEVRSTGTGDAAISFHRPGGGFACNFGLGSDHNFYMGGWSYGAATHRFWTTRDFTSGVGLLGFTPVQQSGGAYQATNKIYIGWDGGGLRAQVDATDLGNFAFGGTLAAYLSNGRTPHAGDWSPPADTGTYHDCPWSGAVASGGYSVTYSGTYPPYMLGLRMRYVQGYRANVGWFSFVYA